MWTIHNLLITPQECEMHCLHHVMELKEKELSEMKTLLLLKQLPSPKRQRRFVCISIVIVKWGGGREEWWQWVDNFLKTFMPIHVIFQRNN